MLDRSKMTRRPSHPGAIIRAHYMEPLGLTVTALAEHLDISRKTLSQIINEHARVTPDIARRLSRAFNTSVDLWIGLQSGRDVWDAENAPGEWRKIEQLPGLKTTKDEEARVYPVRLYDIRHLFASTILANGGDLKAVSKLLGHSNTRMTADIYYHELKGEKAAALSRKPMLTL